MAIKIKNLNQISTEYTNQQYVYKDLSLDLKIDEIRSLGYSNSIQSADIKPSYDLNAITNSLTNLFNTLPGQRFLFPEYGLNLYQFLFEPVTKFNGEFIGRKIFDSIQIYEPRVNPLKVSVYADYDNSLYEIDIYIEIPILNLKTNTQFLLDTKKQSFIFLPSSKNI